MSKALHKLLILSCFLTPLSWLLAPVSFARAGLDPELKTPYRLQVVLDIAKHRLLTPVFCDQLQRDLRDILQANLGDLARVEVVRDHPLLKTVQANGLEKALDGYRSVSKVKTHVVQVAFAGGRYAIQARQHDGMTGMPSPLVRTAQTTDRGLVARQAALLVDRDFGLVGTITKINDTNVELSIKGGKVGVNLQRWLDLNEVFAIAQISRGGRGLHSVRMLWALLQVTSKPSDGVCTCKFYHRFKTDRLSDESEALGYRCLKLGTIQAPLRLRLHDKNNSPYDGLQVHVSETGFGIKTKNYTTNEEGLIQTEEDYSHVAFVRVLSEGKVRAQLPIAMLADRTLDCLIHISEDAEAEGYKIVRRNRWVRRIYDSLRVAADRVTKLNQMGEKSLRQDALEKAREGLKNLEADINNLTDERERLNKDGVKDLGEGEQRLEELRKRQQELERFVSRLDKLIKEEKDPKKREMLAMIERAQLLLTQAEFEQAKDLYEKILDANPKQTNVRKRFAKLSKALAIKNKEHRKARDYIYKDWPKPKDPAALLDALKQIENAFDTCRKFHDGLSPQKILLANVTHADNLKKRLALLRPRTREDDRKEAEVIAKAADRLKTLHEKITTYLKEEKPAFP